MDDDTDGVVRGRVWRDGQVVAEDFDFARISDYLEDPKSLTWVDICDPDHRILQDLAGVGAVAFGGSAVATSFTSTSDANYAEARGAIAAI